MLKILINILISESIQTPTDTPSLVLHTLCGHSFVLVYLRK